ncbi:MAG TPA: tRNA (adenosine(37)-N6)-threonylcarbamoyltransferase complex dimerization subunit type 1 TsaB [Sphingomonadaceae bacterium]|nr:tRNA (adenosine(37)-N6)-threonylcarbamoyltransferase complex dimerization subunit type 1 TsaB [Sphingomonadaceae bacterium]
MLLVIETATAALSVALIEGECVTAHHHEVVGRGHAERLLPVIRDMLGSRVPDAIAVDCGPGSFTGVRVGLAAAQGLRIAWGVPVHGYGSLSLVAAGFGERAASAVALTGGHGELFVEMFDAPPLRSTGPLRSLPPAEAAAAIGHARIIGSGAAALVAARGWGQAVDALPRAADFVHLPRELASLKLRPIYGRAPDAKPLPVALVA